MALEGIKLFDIENVKKIRLKGYTWEVLLLNKRCLYEEICNLLFSEENLFYYVTQKESTKTLSETRDYVRKLISLGIIDKKINDVFKVIGWESEKLNINNTRFQGDLAEYLMCILVDMLTSIDTIISKTSLKTSPGMPSFGNDNIFYDYEKDILYFGEAKFYSDIDDALKEAVKSLSKHEGDMEISFISSHTASIIGKDGQRRGKLVEQMETRSNGSFSTKKIIFIANDDIYLKKDYEEAIIKKFGNVEKLIADGILLAVLPILSKNEFLEYFKERLKNDA